MIERWICKRYIRAAALCLVTVLLAIPSARSTAIAQQSAATETEKPASKPIPRGPKRYKGREIAVTMHYLGAPWLVRESRQREEDCAMLLEALHVKPGQTICDLGCGNGFYTLQLAKLVGDQGKVFAVDIQPEMLHLLDERAKAEEVTNIEPSVGSQVDTGLAPQSVDLILLVDVYHEFSHPHQMLSAMRRALKPGGRIALAEFREEDPAVPIKPLHKMSKKQILKEFSPSGFRLVEEFDKLPWQHLMFFEKTEKSGEDDQ